MNLFKYRKSLTKNWPGGRRNATDNHVWNKRTADFKATWVYGIRQPYLTPIPKSEGGMATPSEGPETCDSSSNIILTP